MRASPEHSVPPRHSVRTLILGAIASGTFCFLAGRFTAPRHSDQLTTDLSTESAAQSSASNNFPTAALASGSEVQPQTNRAAGPSGWDEKQWQKLLAQPGSPARTEALTALLERLAAADPDRAISLARAQANLKLREALMQAALHGWARTAPARAADWALALTDANERERALSTVFAGAVAASPDDAVQWAKGLFQRLPDDAGGYGASLIEALCANGSFETAARFASGGGAQIRAGWMANAYSRWAQFQPQTAANAAAAIQDPELRNEALHGIVGGWSEADPEALVQFVTRLPPDPERGSLLSQSLERWAKNDPESASAWINTAEVGPDMDEGVAAVATMPSLNPELAVGWAESVVDPKLRSETLVTVVRNWLVEDLPAAEHFFETTKNLLPDDRHELSEVFASFSRDAGRQ